MNVGRKGWLFADTCKANGIDPHRYLVSLFTKPPRASTAVNYATLIPWAMLAASDL
jgi:hypothetical protein